MITAEFQNRLFQNFLIPSDMKFSVKRYNFDVIGGEYQATVEVTGNKNSIFALIGWLRYSVKLRDNRTNKRWNGYISKVTINWDEIAISASIDTMTNNAAVAYTDSNIRYTTAWSADTTSTAEYGTKEALLSKDEVSAALALQYRDTELQSKKYPIPGIPTFGKSSTTQKATIECYGWAYTLKWRFYANNSGKESYETLGEGGREIGEDERPNCAMSFQISSTGAWDMNAIWLHCYKYPSSAPPTDNLVCSLYSNSGVDPNVSLTSGALAGAAIGTSSDWLKFVMGASVTLNPATTYWIVVSRSGVTDATKYFMVDTNRDNGYTKGSLKLYDTTVSAWHDYDFKGDMNFIVEGGLEITQQITNMIASIGEFVVGTVIEKVSGVETLPYRDGDNTAWYELLKLLEVGTTDDKRLLCKIDENRYLRVYEEPAQPTSMENAYKLDGKGNLYDPFNRLVDPSECVTGVWCALKDVIPESVDISKLGNISPFFIEEAEYNADNNTYSILRSKNQTDVFDIGGID